MNENRNSVTEIIMNDGLSVIKKLASSGVNGITVPFTIKQGRYELSIKKVSERDLSNVNEHIMLDLGITVNELTSKELSRGLRGAKEGTKFFDILCNELEKRLCEEK